MTSGECTTSQGFEAAHVMLVGEQHSGRTLPWTVSVFWSLHPPEAPPLAPPPKFLKYQNGVWCVKERGATATGRDGKKGAQCRRPNTAWLCIDSTPAFSQRGSVAAQGGIDPTKMQVNLATMPKVEKSDEALKRLKESVNKNILMSALSQEYKDAVIASMKEVKVAAGEYIITQGEAGDNWYVVESGALDAWKKFEPTEEAPGKKVKSYSTSDSFGELALMYNQRRAASVIASTDSVLWAVDQTVFKSLILSASTSNKQTYS